MSTQNPILPTATDLKGIDATIYDIQTYLDTALVWLTNGQGRAYKLSKVKNNDTTVFLPEVYLGGNQSKYFAATPDNDKKGQSIFILGNESYLDYRVGRYGQKTYDVSIIFSCNLKLIDATLLLTEDFTRHQIMDAEEALTRGLLGKAYRLVIDNCVTEFDDVYSGFDVSKEYGASLAPMSYFRFNCTVTLDEDCAGVSLDRCGAINQNLSQSDICSCVIPNLDFSISGSDYACLSAQQIADVLAQNAYFYTTFDGSNESIQISNSTLLDFSRSDPFTINMWINTDTLAAVQMPMGNYAGWGFYFRILTNGKLSIYVQGDLGIGFNYMQIDSNINLLTLTDYMLTVSFTGLNTGLANEFTLYIDGVDVGVVIKDNLTITDFKTNTSNSFSIGKYGANNSYFLNGKVYQFAAWSAAKTGIEITSMLADGKNNPDYSLYPNLLLHYKMDTLNPVDYAGTSNGTSVNMDASNIVEY